MTEIERKCGNCGFFKSHGKIGPWGDCKIFPPKYLANNNVGCFPKVEDCDWCGEFKQKEDSPNEVSDYRNPKKPIIDMDVKTAVELIEKCLAERLEMIRDVSIIKVDQKYRKGDKAFIDSQFEVVCEHEAAFPVYDNPPDTVAFFIFEYLSKMHNITFNSLGAFAFSIYLSRKFSNIGRLCTIVYGIREAE